MQQAEEIPQKMPLHKSLSGKGDMVMNNAGGYVFTVDDMMRLQRFIIIGCEGGSYYAKEGELKRENVTCIDRLISQGKGRAVVEKIRDISVNRRNFRQQSLLLAFSICARSNDLETKKAAYEILSEVCRIPTHLFMFIKYCQEQSSGSEGPMGPTGWGRAHKRAVSKWYTGQKPKSLAEHVTKYKNREGWTHRDVLRLAHASTKDEAVGFVLRYIVKGLEGAENMYVKGKAAGEQLKEVANYLSITEKAIHTSDVPELCAMIKEYKLSWEHCPSSLLQSKEVWESLLKHMKPDSLIRNLGRMTSYGLFADGSESETLVLKKIKALNSDEERNDDDDTQKMEVDGQQTGKKRKNIIHPFRILIALETYRNCTRGEKLGKLTWTPNQKIVSALDDAFYAAFQHVESTNKKYYLGVDVSGSMGSPVLGTSTIYCSTAAAAMMMVTAKTERNSIIRGFTGSMRDLGITREDTLTDVQRKVNHLTFGTTDCAQPMIDAMESRIKDIDVFIIYTDCETWIGRTHPSVALRRYREYAKSDPDRDPNKPPAKLIVCGMTANEFTIADPEDTGMLDMCGFDADAPKVISEFALGNI